VVFALLFVCAAAAYLYRVHDVPSASGDEGNWMAMGLRIHRGLPTRLPADARFVTTAFARMIAMSYRVAGVSIGAARGTQGVSVLAGLVLVIALAARARATLMGLAACAMLATHPWTVWWCRSVVAPYPVALSLATVGPIAWVLATQRYGAAEIPHAREAWRRHLWLVLAGQLLALELHFTPFAILPLIACGLWSFVTQAGRRSLRTPGPYLALVAALVHALPIARSALQVVASHGQQSGSRFTDFQERLYNLLRSLADGFSGEQTLRDYVGDNVDASLGWTLSRGVTVALLALAWGLAACPPLAREQDREGSASVALRRFAAMYFPMALLAFPFVLAPARDWWLATIDNERYLFALLAPAALLLGAGVQRAPRTVGLVVALLSAYFVLGPNARAVRYYWHGGGPDYGYFSAHHGGAYRGYKVLPGPRSVTLAIHERCVHASRGRRATLAFDDYAFHPVRVLLRIKPEPRMDSVYLRDAELPAGRFVCIPVWSPELFPPGHIPATAVSRNEWVRGYIATRLDGARRIESWRQPDGHPLLELWTGTVRPPATASAP
jgi:hypothetical protein